jgi:MOSC domain-containing protein YiiM
MGRVEQLWIKPARRAPMRPVPHARFVEKIGIDGNAEGGGRRPVTVLSQERWNRALDELGATVDPVLRRANVLVSGLDLVDTRGRVLAIGDVRLRIGGENRPCRLMDTFHHGLQTALDLDWGGGVYATVTTGGIARVGDDVVWMEGAE